MKKKQSLKIYQNKAENKISKCINKQNRSTINLYEKLKEPVLKNK